MFCTKCAHAIPDGAKFCPLCGTVVAAAPPPSPEAAAAQPAAGPRADLHAAAAYASGLVPPGLVARVKNILLSPSTEWPVIDSESSSQRAIYLQYVAPLAAIGAIAGFIGHSVIGISVPFLGTYRTPMLTGLASALFLYALTFVMIFLMALLVDVLAPTFGGQRDSLRALKVTVYSFTPAWIAGVLQLLPFLGIIGLFAGLYGLYLLYLGLPFLMRCPKEKAVGYTVVIVLCAIVMSAVIGWISSMAFGGFGVRPFAGIDPASRAHVNEQAGADAAAGILSGMFGGKTDADKQRVADAIQQLAKAGQQAEKAANAASPSASPPAGAPAVDAANALGAIGKILTGGSDIKPVDFRKLKEMLPETVQGMKRDNTAGESSEAMGIKGSSATAHYSNDAGARVKVEITDTGSLSGLAGLAARFDPNMQKETDTGYERTTKSNGQVLHERYDRQAKSGEVSILTGDRFSITVSGSGVDADVLTAALKVIDIGRLATLASATK